MGTVERPINPDFTWTSTKQLHLRRRREIVKKHPEVKQFFGIDPSFQYVVAANVLIQVIACFLLKDSDWTLIMLQAYCFGGIINHGLTLAIHDISHNVVYGNRRPLANRIFGIFANLPIGIPISISFKKYHVEHHRYLGEENLDTDVPTKFEARFFTTKRSKFMWLLLQPLFYAFRPLIIYKKAPTDLELLNALVQVIFDLFIWYFCGIKGIFYLIFGTLIAMGVHPSAGHFVAEHYEFYPNQETYSYYGPMNLVTYNVGYHIEHHDFPYVPGRNLPKIRDTAPEFYLNMPRHDSWVWVLYQFVVNPAIGPFARIKRKASVEQEYHGNNMLGEYVDAFMVYLGLEDLQKWYHRYFDPCTCNSKVEKTE